MKNPNSKIKAIIFDVGGVLQLYQKSTTLKRPHHSVHEYVAKKFKKDLDSWFDSIDTAYSKSMGGKIKSSIAISSIAKNLNTNKKHLSTLFNKAYKKLLGKNQELYNLAHNLKSQGYIIGILSDQWALSKPMLMPKKDIKDFDITIASCDVGIRKPNPEIYKLLIKKLKQKNNSINPSEIVFIDNRKWNLPQAKKLGIKTILFKNNKQLIKELKKLGVKW